MEIKSNKVLYEAPSTQVFEVKTEGVVCASPIVYFVLIGDGGFGGNGIQDYGWNEYDE